MSLLACSAFVGYSPAQANCLSLGEINSSQLVYIHLIQAVSYIHFNFNGDHSFLASNNALPVGLKGTSVRKYVKLLIKW